MGAQGREKTINKEHAEGNAPVVCLFVANARALYTRICGLQSEPLPARFCSSHRSVMFTNSSWGAKIGRQHCLLLKTKVCVTAEIGCKLMHFRVCRAVWQSLCSSEDLAGQAMRA